MNVFKQKEREFAVARVRRLRDKFPETVQILDFLERVLEFQSTLIENLSEGGAPIKLSGAEARIKAGKPALNLGSVDLDIFVKHVPPFLDLIEEHGTEEIREGVRELRALSRDKLASLFKDFFEDKDVGSLIRLVVIGVAQPVLYASVGDWEFKHEWWLRNTCPLCGSKPSVSFLMDTEEWEGARFLRCGLCLTDWLYPRTQCVNCGNNEDDKLSYFVEQGIGYIELQTCSECKRYIKLIDMRKDGLAVPDVDDVASLSLDLWVQSRGYTKVERNILDL
ncbi:formate dehydrogenase accessory protein FdhE [Hydrogenivirga sp.]